MHTDFSILTSSDSVPPSLGTALLVVPLILTRTHKRRFQQSKLAAAIFVPDQAPPRLFVQPVNLPSQCSFRDSRLCQRKTDQGASSPSEQNPIHVDPFSMRTRESSNTAPTVSLSTASGHHSVKLGGTHPSQASQATTRQAWSPKQHPHPVQRGSAGG